MKIRNVLVKIFWSLMVFGLVLLIGWGGWELLRPYRVELARKLVVQAWAGVEEDKPDALWDLEKAYLVGLGYEDFRVNRALAWAKLGDRRAEAELWQVVESGWADDRVNFEYGKLKYLAGDYQAAESSFVKISKGADLEIQVDVLKMLADMAARKGDWLQAENYLNQAVKKTGFDESINKYFLALNLAKGEVETAEKYNHDLLDLSDLTGKRDDSYVLMVADKMIDLGLASWSRAYLDQDYQGILAKRDWNKIYGRSFLAEGGCDEALIYLRAANELDSTDENVHELLAETYRCLGEEEWLLWEEGILKQF